MKIIKFYKLFTCKNLVSKFSYIRLGIFCGCFLFLGFFLYYLHMTKISKQWFARIIHALVICFLSTLFPTVFFFFVLL